MKKGNKIFLKVGVGVCLASALFSIFSLFLNLLISSGSEASESYDYSSIFSLALNVMFYVLVALQFKKAYSNKAYARSAVLILAICEFLIPIISYALISLLYYGVFTALYLAAILIISSIIGILYAIFLILYSRKNKKGLLITLRVFGILLAVIGIISFISNANLIITNINLLLSSTSEENAFILNLANYIVSFIIALIELGFYYIYAYYPFYISKE